MFVSLGGDQTALAAQPAGDGSFLLPVNQEQPPIEERLEPICEFPVLEGKSGDSFDFEFTLKWHSSEFREFDITATGPANWTLSLLGGFEKTPMAKRIGLQPLEPGKTYPTKTVYLRLTPPKGSKPEPGEYKATFGLSSGEIHEVVDLIAVVTAVYQFDFYPVTGRLNMEAKAGEENYLKVWVENTGTAVLDSVRLSSVAPQGWKVTFNPDQVKSLEPGLAQEVTVTVEPPDRTIAGDYAVTLYANSEDYSAEPLRLRVTVLTPTIWGWVGILIVLAVIAGLAIIFRRLGRR